MSDVTVLFVYLVTTYALGPLQFGYHIGELNTPQAVISCEASGKEIFAGSYGLLSCIRMNAVQYGTVVSIFPVGGLVGSLIAGRLADTYGRRRVTMVNSIGFIVGPMIMATANHIWTIALGRFLSGFSSGISMVSVPIYLNEISPITIRGTVGVMTQLFCVIGILSAQIAGVYLSDIYHWRLILAIGAIIGIVQFLLLWFTVESPKWLATQNGKFSDAKLLLVRLRGRSDIESEMKLWTKDEDEENADATDAAHGGEEDRSLLTRIQHHETSSAARSLSLKTFLTKTHYRSAIRAVVLTQLAQQFTGTNAVIFYSTSILATLLPDLSAWISVGISVVNLLVTILAANLIDRTGRRILLLISLLGMTLSSLLLAVGINNNIKSLSAIAAMAIIGSFGLGLGPIPFLLISEFFEVEAVGLGQSLGLAVNWTATFCIGFFFPIMRQNLGGSSFYIFSSLALLVRPILARHNDTILIW